MLKKKILSTENTPEISLNPDGLIRITGRSMNGNISEFSKQIDDWMDEYISNPAELTCVDFYLEYINGINSNIYISLLRKIDAIKLKNKKYIVNWYYEEGDEDILEKGEYVSFILDIPFNFIEIHDPLLTEHKKIDWNVAEGLAN